MCGPPLPNVYAGCFNKCSCNFLFVARVGLCCRFCDFTASFLVPPDGPKNVSVKVLFFCSSTKLCMLSQNGTAWRSHFWDRVLVHVLKFFASGLQKRKVLVSMKLCGL